MRIDRASHMKSTGQWLIMYPGSLSAHMAANAIVACTDDVTLGTHSADDLALLDNTHIDSSVAHIDVRRRCRGRPRTELAGHGQCELPKGSQVHAQAREWSSTVRTMEYAVYICSYV